MGPSNQQSPQQTPPKSDVGRIVGLLLFLSSGSIAVFFGIFGTYIFIIDSTSEDGAAKGIASLAVLIFLVPIVIVSTMVSVAGYVMYKKHSKTKS